MLDQAAASQHLDVPAVDEETRIYMPGMACEFMSFFFEFVPYGKPWKESP